MPSASTDPNEALAGRISAGVEAWGFDARTVAGCLLCHDPAHQKRVAQIVFHLIRKWSEMAGHGFGDEHAMSPEWNLSRAMMANLSNVEMPA